MAKRYRFPGVNSFTKNDVAIFKGRDADARNIYKQLMLFKTLVLHSESGTGKSSIIQAGLLPLIESPESGYVPFIINLNDIVTSDAETVLTDHSINKILSASPGIDAEKLELPDDADRSFWVLAKKLEKKGKSLLLIFDQFETLQSFSTPQVQKFKEELLKLLNNRIPAEIYEAIQKVMTGLIKQGLTSDQHEELNRNYKFLSSPVNAKALFVIREDKLGTMSLLSDYFPDILKNDFILPSLTKDNAYRALVEPAIAAGDNFASIPFSFEKEADAWELINVIADDQTQMVDPMQLQIAASSIERNVVIREHKNIITKNDIPKIVDIINAYYKGCWERVNEKLNEKGMLFTQADFDKKRKAVIDKLIVNDRRNLVHSDLFISKANKASDKSFIDELLAEGLIRKIPSGKDLFYQLCHDRFIKPVTDDIAWFEEKESVRLKLLENEKIQQELEAERKRQDAEIERQKKYIAEVELARKQADQAQEEALNALIENEKIVKVLNASNLKMKKYRNYIFAAAVIIFGIGLYSFWSAMKSRDLTRVNIANRLITEAWAEYENEKHDIAFRKLLEAADEQKSDSARQLIESLTFYEISAKQIVVSNKNIDVVAAIYPDKTATIWNIKGPRLIRIKDLVDVDAVRISNSGRHVAYTRSNRRILSIISIGDDNKARLVKDSIILNVNENKGVSAVENEPEFDITDLYSFRFSPKENYAYYRLDDLKIRLIELGSKSKKDIPDTKLLDLLKPQVKDTVIWLGFSFDEKTVATYRQRTGFQIFNFTENKYIYKPKVNVSDIYFLDAAPVFYSVEQNQSNAVGNILEVVNFQTMTKSILKSQTGFYKVDGAALDVQDGILAYKTTDSICKIVNVENGRSGFFRIAYGEGINMFSLSDRSKFCVFNGLDSIFELSKTDLKINKAFSTKNAANSITIWQNDNTISWTNDKFIFLLDIGTGKTDSLPYKGINLEGISGSYLRAGIKQAEHSEKNILFKPQLLNLEDKIKYFDSLYPIGESYKK